MTLLYIECSPKKTHSGSSRVAQTFLEGYRRTHPEHRIQILDLWQADLPELNAEQVGMTYKQLFDTPLSEAENNRRSPFQTHAQQFADANKYVFSLPMWNFGIPYKLKHFIDVVTLKGLPLTFHPKKAYKV